VVPRLSRGNLLPIRVLAATVAEIARVVRVPLSVDFESEYSSDPAIVGENVAQLIDAGAVGINLEDGSSSPDLLCAKIAQVKRTAARLGTVLFVNARTDTYLRALVPAEHRLGETLARAVRYRAAGADGIFVPGVGDAPTITALVPAVKLPLNVLARAGLPATPVLAALGVRRLSAGSGIASAAYGLTAAVAADFLRHGVSANLAEGPCPTRKSTPCWLRAKASAGLHVLRRPLSLSTMAKESFHAAYFKPVSAAASALNYSAPDLTRHAPRSPRTRLGGYVHLPRLLDKARAVAAGRGGDFHYNCPFDVKFFAFTGLKHVAFTARIKAGKSDSEMLAYVESKAKPRRNAWEITGWSAWMEQWTVSTPDAREFFSKIHRKNAPQRADIATWFDWIELDDYVTFGGRP